MNSSVRTVRKRVDDDCLLHGDLHPSVAERLDRVRELPVRNVANLIGVERNEEGVWLVWQYIEGISLEQFLRSPSEKGLEFDRIARELRRAVLSLHAQGIVHGNLHARNVIINSSGAVWLTHISPLLFSNVEQDEKALEALMTRLGQTRGRRENSGVYNDSADRAVRVRAYLIAGAALLGGVVMFLAILWYIRT